MKTILIGDIHGRSIWKRIVADEKPDRVVFIGDYFDSFDIPGVTHKDVVGVDNWFKKYTMTIEQSNEFKKWGKKYLMKELRETAKSAEREMMWFNLQYGLTYSDWERYNKTSNEDENSTL